MRDEVQFPITPEPNANRENRSQRYELGHPPRGRRRRRHDEQHMVKCAERTVLRRPARRPRSAGSKATGRRCRPLLGMDVAVLSPAWRPGAIWRAGAIDHGTGAGPRRYVMRVDRLAAVLAHGDASGVVSARIVPQEQRRALGSGQVLIAPAERGEDDVVEVAAAVGEAVLVPVGPLVVDRAVEHAGLDQALEAAGQEVAGDAQVSRQLREPAHAEERLAQDQEGPAVADHRHGPFDGVGGEPLGVGIGFGHGCCRTMTSLVSGLATASAAASQGATRLVTNSGAIWPALMRSRTCGMAGRAIARPTWRCTPTVYISNSGSGVSGSRSMPVWVQCPPGLVDRNANASPSRERLQSTVTGKVSDGRGGSPPATSAPRVSASSSRCGSASRYTTREAPSARAICTA